ncbi:hypothetical protein CTI12_AA289840 [Artemisia annua]|uniref:Uncharacterized protein n=1 Tax=Artemisia annua TaxID=35608 RepID=A0A2U1NA20_ARTAN|nr:hypothetical protein CTI12_AA289840 [Artemisia annua]
MMNQVSSRKKPMNVVRIIKTPLRAISKALDLYVKSISKLANTSSRSIMTTEDTPNSQRLPRSVSTSRILYNDPPTESALVRSISSAPTSCRSSPMRSPDLELYMRQQHGSRKGVPRSCSVGMGKIDEDRALSFRKDNIVVISKLGIKNDDSALSDNLIKLSFYM